MTTVFTHNDVDNPLEYYIQVVLCLSVCLSVRISTATLEQSWWDIQAHASRVLFGIVLPERFDTYVYVSSPPRLPNFAWPISGRSSPNPSTKTNDKTAPKNHSQPLDLVGPPPDHRQPFHQLFWKPALRLCEISPAAPGPTRPCALYRER